MAGKNMDEWRAEDVVHNPPSDAILANESLAWNSPPKKIPGKKAIPVMEGDFGRKEATRLYVNDRNSDSQGCNKKIFGQA